MEAVYEAPYAIPQLDIEAGDLITIRVSHPENPFVVSRSHGRHALAKLLPHIEFLTPIYVPDPSSSTADPQHEFRIGPRRAGPRRRRHLRIVQGSHGS